MIQDRIIYKKTLAIELMQNGAELLKAVPHKKTKLLLFFFNDDEKLKKAFDEVNKKSNLK